VAGFGGGEFVDGPGEVDGCCGGAGQGCGSTRGEQRKNYEIDLSDENAARFREALAPLIERDEAGHQRRGGSSTQPPAVDGGTVPET
jgi:hypothetical protein